MKEDKNELAPGIYILTCIESTAFDCCLFEWEKGDKYRLQVNVDGTTIMEAKGLLFSPQERLKDLLKCFIVEADLNNRVGVYKYFYQKRDEDMNESNGDR